jgi:hypothetical protein
MSKESILHAIKTTAQKNGGKPLGQERFARETSIQISHWQKYWIRWSQALSEAGFEPNEYKSAYSEEHILEKLAILTRELQHFPVTAEIKMKGREDKDFPSHTVFNRIGQKKVLLRKLYEYVLSKEQFKDISEIVNNENNKFEDEEQVAVQNKSKGYVYLVKHGSRREYKIGRTNNQIRREGELSIELPEKLSPVHYIETDDPSGIEKYWHSRFSEKRKNGEWFNLSAEDVQAFKRWKKIF